MSPASSSAADVASTSVLERAQSFFSEHKQAVLFGAAAVIAAGGVAFYTASSGGAYDDLESGRKKKKRATKKKGGKESKDVPIIDDAPRTTEEVLAASSKADEMTLEERKSLASELKLKGNKAYTERKFEEAVTLYTRAIEVTPEPDPVFYSNRAASYMYYPVPEYEKAIADCTEALRINPKHERSIGRRATALEKLGRFEEALRDFTAATLLTKFGDQKMAEAVERVLRQVTDPKAREIFKTREPRLPPHTFVEAYFGAFRQHPDPELPENSEVQGDNTLKLALGALNARDYPHSLTLVNECIEQGLSTPLARAHALNLRGSFRFLMGDSQGASDDLQAAIEAAPQFTQSWVKIASVHMEQGKPAEAFQAFEEATKHNKDDADIYYHRGQVLFIMQQFKEAAENYEKSYELDPTFVFSHIQLAVAQYKSGDLQEAMGTFRKALKAFPQRSEPYNYYGELLLDQRRFEEAIEKFDRAIELERQKAPPMNVLAMVNKGLTLFQWRNDLVSAEAIIKEALEADPDCEAAVATLAQIALQRGDYERAVELFGKQVELARTEQDITNALQFMHAAKAQSDFSKDYPDIAASFREAQAMAAFGNPAAFM